MVELVAIDECVGVGAGSGWFGEWSWWSVISGVVGIDRKLGAVVCLNSVARSMVWPLSAVSAGKLWRPVVIRLLLRLGMV